MCGGIKSVREHTRIVCTMKEKRKNNLQADTGQLQRIQTPTIKRLQYLNDERLPAGDHKFDRGESTVHEIVKLRSKLAHDNVIVWMGLTIAIQG